MIESQDVRDALDAIIRCYAIPEAYQVAAQAGWHELFPGVIYREERNSMEITIAREIITQAQKDETYAGPMPDDDATIIKEAESLVTMAEQAWTQHIRGPEVEAILKLASGDGGNGDRPSSESAPEGEEQASEAKVEAEIPEQWTKTEPWEGYGDDTVQAVTEGINLFIEEKPDDLVDILRHVRAFETAHRRRVRVIGHVNSCLEKLGVETHETEAADKGPGEQISGEPAEGEPSPEATSTTAEADGVGAEGPSSAAEGEGESSDAQSHAESETRTESGEGHADEAEPHGEDQRQRSDQRAEGDDGEASSAYQKLLDRVETELRNERLDIPKPPEEKAPELPWRWNEISDSDLRDYHMQFASLAYYKSYVYAREERVAMLCKEAADELRNALMVRVDKYDDHNKEKKVGLIEAEIESDPKVRRWRKLQRKHEQFAQASKREMESYYKLVEALSRLESMRHNAWERARR